MNKICEEVISSKILQEINLEQCRLCQVNTGDIEFVTNFELLERIKTCTRIQFEEDHENLPKSICTTCNQLLDSFFLFQENCLKIDEQLRQLLETKKISRPVRRCLDKICEKCGETKKKGRHTCKEVENIPIKTEPKAEWIKAESPELTSDNIEPTDDEKPETEDLPKSEENSIEVLPKVKKTRKKKDVKQPESYSCPVTGCTKTCPNKGALRSHKYHQHGIRKFLCTVCGKSFRALCNLKSHEAVHLQTKPFQCTKCSMRFGYATNLKVHIKNHHEGHRYYCTKCGKAFLTSCTLKRHELIHVGKKDFKCDICTSAFYTQKELIKHKKYHYDIRAYFCNICYKSFVAKDHLTVHMRSHTGERPYVCNVSGCGQGFVTSGKVRRHQRTVHRLNL